MFSIWGANIEKKTIRYTYIDIFIKILFFAKVVPNRSTHNDFANFSVCALDNDDGIYSISPAAGFNDVLALIQRNRANLLTKDIDNFSLGILATQIDDN